MKSIMIVLLLLFISSCQIIPKTWRGPNQEFFMPESKPRHFIFTIHGLAGKPNTFGYLLPALEYHLEATNSSYDVITGTFNYPTGDKGVNVEVFVKQFENYLLTQISENGGLNSNDKISIVAHSQGGLITALWYLKAIYGNNKEQYNIAEKVSGVVTLGTPFWGSKTAYIIKDRIPFEFLQKLIYKVMKISEAEVTDLASGSEKIYDYFYSIAAAKSVNIYNDPRMLNIVGVVPDWSSPFVSKFLQTYEIDMSPKTQRRIRNFFKYRVNMGNRWESDQVVAVASARMGFLYYSDTLYQQVRSYKPDVVTLNDFEYSRFYKSDSQYLLQETVHASPRPKENYDMAYIPENCMVAADCDHPTYKNIFRHLINCESQNSTCNQELYQKYLDTLFIGDKTYGRSDSQKLLNEMRTFNLGFNIKFPKNFKVPKELLDREDLSKFIRVDYVYGFKKSDNKDARKIDDGLIRRKSDEQDFRIQVGRYREWGSRVIKYFKHDNVLNLQLSGNVQPADVNGELISTTPEWWDTNRAYPLDVIVDIPGLKKRYITLPVRPTYTTFIDLVLEKP